MCTSISNTYLASVAASGGCYEQLPGTVLRMYQDVCSVVQPVQKTSRQTQKSAQINHL